MTIEGGGQGADKETKEITEDYQLAEDEESLPHNPFGVEQVEQGPEMLNLNYEPDLLSSTSNRSCENRPQKFDCRHGALSSFSTLAHDLLHRLEMDNMKGWEEFAVVVLSPCDLRKFRLLFRPLDDVDYRLRIEEEGRTGVFGLGVPTRMACKWASRRREEEESVGSLWGDEEETADDRGEDISGVEG
eukprot:756198-Hanusia_phi.AAC.2